MLLGLAVTTLFAVLTIVSKENAALNARQPWQDDPYDVLVSLEIVVLPVLVVAAAARAMLCRWAPGVPTRRLVDLLRAAGVALGICLATQLAEWNSVLLGRHRADWNTSTTQQIAMLGVLTGLTLWASVAVGRASRSIRSAETVPAQPDWLTDLVALGMVVATRVGSRRAVEVVVWFERAVIRRVRRHPTSAAGLFALWLASPFIAAKIFVEGYPFLLVLVVTAFVWACLFVLVVVLGTYLNVVAELPSPSPVLVAILGGCVCGTVLFAFHDSLLGHQTIGGLAALLAGGGVAGAAASFAVTTWQTQHPNTTSCYLRRVLRGSPGHRAERGLPPP